MQILKKIATISSMILFLLSIVVIQVYQRLMKKRTVNLLTEHKLERTMLPYY